MSQHRTVLEHVKHLELQQYNVPELPAKHVLDTLIQAHDTQPQLLEYLEVDQDKLENLHHDFNNYLMRSQNTAQNFFDQEIVRVVEDHAQKSEFLQESLENNLEDAYRDIINEYIGLRKGQRESFKNKHKSLDNIFEFTPKLKKQKNWALAQNQLGEYKQSRLGLAADLSAHTVFYLLGFGGAVAIIDAAVSSSLSIDVPQVLMGVGAVGTAGLALQIPEVLKPAREADSLNEILTDAYDLQNAYQLAKNSL